MNESNFEILGMTHSGYRLDNLFIRYLHEKRKFSFFNGNVYKFLDYGNFTLIWSFKHNVNFHTL